ncbi:MAG TPA: lysylphosphatidylglycerol synthase transmembrane domain-containing protein [candidate division Zixibacteria bacterium]|nr:lysylphosphatidylglycerol synthase transmembrane domain-containing protein [candidate division Zixibacteria bacterium]
MILKKKQFWGTLIAIALLAFCVKDIRIADLQTLSHRLDLTYLIPTIVCGFLFIFIKGLRWRIFAAPQKWIRPFRAISLYSAGQVINIVMPALAGQVGRLFLFSKTEGLKKTFVFSTIVLEILLDSLSLIVFLLLTSVAFVVPDQYRTVGYILAAATVFVFVLLYLILHFQHRIEESAAKHLRHRWPGFYIGVKKFLRSFVQGINLLRSTQHFATTFGYSIVAWIFHTSVIFFLLRSFGFHLPFAAAASVMIINTLALMIPITPGNAGTFEVAVSTSLLAFSVPRTDAVLFALALHLLDLLPIVTLGFIFLRQERLSLREIKNQHEDDELYSHVSEEGTFVETEEESL